MIAVDNEGGSLVMRWFPVTTEAGEGQTNNLIFDRPGTGPTKDPEVRGSSRLPCRMPCRLAPRLPPRLP